MNKYAILLEQINTYFNLDELKTICFNLRVDYDNLTGEGKSGRIRELILCLERRGQINHLLTQLERLRPNVKWTSIDILEPTSTWIDTIYHFNCISDPPGSAFRLRMSHQNAKAIVMVSQQVDTALSIMNVIESVATDIARTYGLSAGNLIFIEHYPSGYFHDNRETYELVQFNWDGSQFSSPRWCPISKEQVQALLMHPL